MRLLHKLILPACIAAALSSCVGSNNNSSSDTRSMSQRAYSLGVEDANAIVSECQTEEAVRIRLLDIRARATNIKNRISEDASEEYLSGFKHGLEQHGDTLATILFD